MEPDWATADGSVRLYCRDCLEVLPTLEAGSVDVVTDPPYGLGSRLSGGTWGAKFAGGLEWDQVAPEMGLVLNVAKNCILWGGNYFALPPSRCCLIWWKPDAVRTMADAEIAWTNLDANTRVLRHSIAATNPERNGHPTQKPIAVMLWSLAQLPAANETLDPFMGSGTTGVACVRTGRRFIGVEREPKYFDIAVKRIQAELNRAPLFDPAPAVVQRELL